MTVWVSITVTICVSTILSGVGAAAGAHCARMNAAVREINNQVYLLGFVNLFGFIAVTSSISAHNLRIMMVRYW
jgi:hypothetical protein